MTRETDQGPPAASVVDDNLLEVVARGLEGYSKSERRVAEAILADPETVLDMTLAQVSRLAGVSEPSVIRFATSIGCAGFRDLRVKLARSLAFARTTSHAAISGADDLGTIIGKMFDFNLANLNWVSARLDPQPVAAAVAALGRARTIEFFGYGASAIVARDAQQKFPLFGAPCGAPLDGHQMLITAAMMQPGDVAVAISNTGSTAEVVEAARLARASGATTIAITGTRGALARACEIVVLVETLENTDLYTPTVSRLSAMVVIDILSTAVSLARSPQEQARLAAMKATLARHRSRPEEPPDLDGQLPL